MSLDYPLVSFQEGSQSALEKLLEQVKGHLPAEVNNGGSVEEEERKEREKKEKRANEQQQLSFHVRLFLSGYIILSS